MNKLSVLKIVKNLPDAAVGMLEIYKTVLSVKYFAADSLLNGVKFYRNNFTARKTSPDTGEVANVENINVKENTSMKKSTIFALIAFLAAAAGALIAVTAYLKKKEENLREYEEMLFNEDYLADYMPKDEDCCCCEDEEEFCCPEQAEGTCCCEEESEQ